MRKYLRCLVAAVQLVSIGVCARAADRSATARNENVQPTAVAGESWLNHLNRPFGVTSMGKTGRLGPAGPQPGDEVAGSAELLPSSSEPTVTLHGSDLYRLNCQGCHGEAGLGAPPEINSVIDPVRATSVSLVMQRMKSRGMDISSSAATELAQQSQTALLQRLHIGGQDMPPFPHLSEAEIAAIVAYLKQLGGIPGAQNGQLTVRESNLRIGEHIVKATCHTCHDATGANPTAQQLEDGAIPPLQSLTMRVDQVELIRKVTAGAPIVMGTPATPHRGRMPVFDYLTKNEAADVYLYLTQYPPEDVAKPAAVTMAALTVAAPPSGPPAGPTAGSGGSTSTRPSGHISPASTGIDMRIVALLLGTVMFVALLLMGGLGLTLYVFVKLAARCERRNPFFARQRHIKDSPAHAGVRG